MQPDLEKLADRDEEHGISRFFEVLTVFRLLQREGSPAAGKTVETVFDLQGFRITPLKRGVNESQSNCCYLFGDRLVLELE